MEDLGTILENKFKSKAIGKNIVITITIKEANEIIEKLLGADIKKSARAAYIKERVLYVACLDLETAKTIKAKEPKIIDRINNKTGKKTIIKLRYLA